jgi:hypothetical protein
MNNQHKIGDLVRVDNDGGVYHGETCRIIEVDRREQARYGASFRVHALDDDTGAMWINGDQLTPTSLSIYPFEVGEAVQLKSRGGLLDGMVGRVEAVRPGECEVRLFMGEAGVFWYDADEVQRAPKIIYA